MAWLLRLALTSLASRPAKANTPLSVPCPLATIPMLAARPFSRNGSTLPLRFLAYHGVSGGHSRSGRPYTSSIHSNNPLTPRKPPRCVFRPWKTMAYRTRTTSVPAVPSCSSWSTRRPISTLDTGVPGSSICAVTRLCFVLLVPGCRLRCCHLAAGLGLGRLPRYPDRSVPGCGGSAW
jgi:hypothetical protein